MYIPCANTHMPVVFRCHFHIMCTCRLSLRTLSPDDNDAFTVGEDTFVFIEDDDDDSSGQSVSQSYNHMDNVTVYVALCVHVLYNCRVRVSHVYCGIYIVGCEYWGTVWHIGCEY